MIPSQLNQSTHNSGAGIKVTSKVTAKDFASKYRDKREVYHFLSGEAGVYLSSYDTMTVWHLRDLAAGKRRIIKGKDVKHLSVPQFEGLTIKEFLTYANDKPEVLRALPLVQLEIMKLPR